MLITVHSNHTHFLIHSRNNAFLLLSVGSIHVCIAGINHKNQRGTPQIVNMNISFLVTRTQPVKSVVLLSFMALDDLKFTSCGMDGRHDFHVYAL